MPNPQYTIDYTLKDKFEAATSQIQAELKSSKPIKMGENFRKGIEEINGKGEVTSTLTATKFYDQVFARTSDLITQDAKLSTDDKKVLGERLMKLQMQNVKIKEFGGIDSSELAPESQWMPEAVEKMRKNVSSTYADTLKQYKAQQEAKEAVSPKPSFIPTPGTLKDAPLFMPPGSIKIAPPTNRVPLPPKSKEVPNLEDVKPEAPKKVSQNPVTFAGTIEPFDPIAPEETLPEILGPLLKGLQLNEPKKAPADPSEGPVAGNLAKPQTPTKIAEQDKGVNR